MADQLGIDAVAVRTIEIFGPLLHRQIACLDAEDVVGAATGCKHPGDPPEGCEERAG